MFNIVCARQRQTQVIEDIYEAHKIWHMWWHSTECKWRLVATCFVYCTTVRRHKALEMSSL
jgi:hypothetical protein